MPKSSTFDYKKYIAPKYWPGWIGLGFLRLLTLLPFRLQMWLGTVIGYLFYYLAPKRRSIVDTNLRLCFPELSDAERKKMNRDSFVSVGKGIFETAMAWWASQRRLEHRVTVKGLEHLQAALKHGKGVILLSAHFSSLELSGRLLSFQQPFQVTYKRSRNPLMEAILQHSRKQHFIDAINSYDVRAMVNGLKKNLVTWYAMDQDFGLKQSVFVPFMGVMTSTLTTTARLARMSGAVVVPYFPKRLADDSYELTILPELENFPAGDDKVDAERINAIIAEYIRHAPEQYLWAHRRFKTRPPGEPNLYTK